MNTEQAQQQHTEAQEKHDAALSAYGENPSPKAWALVEAAEQEIKKAAAVLGACRRRDADAAADADRARRDALRQDLAAAVAEGASRDSDITSAVERLVALEREAQATIERIRSLAVAAAGSDDAANAIRSQLGESTLSVRDPYKRTRIARGLVADGIRAASDQPSEVSEWLVRSHHRPVRPITEPDEIRAALHESLS